MRRLFTASIAVLTAACLDPLVEDLPGFSVNVLPAGSEVPHVSTNPDLTRQIRVGDGLSDSQLMMSGGLVPQKTGWAKGSQVRYWDLGDAPQVGALLYVLIARGGDAYVTIDHPYVGVALPGDPGYSPFLFVQHVAITDRYRGEILPSADAIADAVELGIVEEPVPAPLWMDAPIVAAGTRLDNGLEPPTETVTVLVNGYRADLLPVGGSAAIRPLARAGRLPRGDVHRVWVGNAINPVSEPTFQNTASSWTPMARVIECKVTPPAEPGAAVSDEAMLFTRDMMGNLKTATDRVMTWEITTVAKNWPLTTRRRAMTRIAMGIVLSLWVAGCAFEPDVGPVLAGRCDPSDSDPEVDVDFGRDIRPLFDRPGSEGGCSCHGSGGTGQQLSGFDMSSLATIRRGGEVSGARIIVPGDPCSSVLVQKLSAAPAVGARMPLSGPPFFSDDELRRVQDWIAEGAIQP